MTSRPGKNSIINFRLIRLGSERGVKTGVGREKHPPPLLQPLQQPQPQPQQQLPQEEEQRSDNNSNTHTILVENTHNLMLRLKEEWKEETTKIAN